MNEERERYERGDETQEQMSGMKGQTGGWKMQETWGERRKQKGCTLVI